MTSSLTALEGMVRIEGGRFLMGSDKHYAEEAPAHPVLVDAFWIDIDPVTNVEFAAFVTDTGYVTLKGRRTRPGRHRWRAGLCLVELAAIRVPRGRVGSQTFSQPRTRWASRRPAERAGPSPRGHRPSPSSLA